MDQEQASTNNIQADSNDKIRPWWQQKSIDIHSKYDTHIKPYLKEIKEWIEQGIPDFEIYQKLGVCKDAWIRYKKEREEIADLYAHKKQYLVMGLEKSLYKKAHGYEFVEKKIVTDADGDIKEQTETTKQMAPDSTALIFALSNLDPDNWKQKQVVETQDRPVRSLAEIDAEIAALLAKRDHEQLKAAAIPLDNGKNDDEDA